MNESGVLEGRWQCKARVKRKPKIDFLHGTVSIPLTKGKTAIVDLVDFPKVVHHNWYLSHYGYAVRNTPRPNRTVVYLHTVIHPTKPGMEVDHRDVDKMNNRRENLRDATRFQNGANIPKFASNTSGFKGVRWYAATGKWNARVHSNRKTFHLGYFDTKEAAYAAYCKKAAELFGEFARYA